MQLNLLQNQFQTIFKVDIQYCNALYYLKSRNNKLFIAQTLKIPYLLMLIIYIFVASSQIAITISILLIVSFILSIFCVVILFYIKNKSRDVILNVQIAHALRHTIQEPFDPTKNYLIFQDWISDTYNARNLQAIAFDSDQQKRLSKAIEEMYINQVTSYKIVFNLVRYLLILISAWILVKIFMNEFNESGLSGYIYIYVFIQFVILEDYNYIIGLIILSPLICVFGCLAAGYQRYKQYKKELKVKLNIKICESDDIMDDCPICFTKFEQKQKVCELQCPGKHIFHEQCIRTWIKVQKTCPVCRHDLVGENLNQ